MVSLSSNKLSYEDKRNQMKTNPLYEFAFYSLLGHSFCLPPNQRKRKQINSTVPFTHSISLLTALQIEMPTGLFFYRKTKSLQKSKDYANKSHAKLKGFFCVLLKNNSTLIKLVHPYLSSILNVSTSITGFKKRLYNRVAIQNHRLFPSYSRRKHKHSYSIIVTNQLRRLSKTFQYLGKNKLNNFITLALKISFSNRKSRTTIARNKLVSPRINYKAIPCLISILETQGGVLLWRNLFKHSLAYSRQTLRHQNVTMPLKNKTVLRLNSKREELRK